MRENERNEARSSDWRSIIGGFNVTKTTHACDDAALIAPTGCVYGLGILFLLIGGGFTAFHQWFIKRRAAREPPLQFDPSSLRVAF
jgi:hypothetical protein